MAGAAAAIDMHPMWVNLEPAMPILEGYEQAEDDRKVYACIASYANSQGIAWPTYRNIVHKTGLALQRVKRSAWRLVFKNLLAIPRKEKKKNDIHPRNIYQINKDFLRQDPDMRSSHFDAEKWKPFAARLKKYVSKAVDQVKQVAVKAAKSMAEKPRKRSKKQWKQSYQRPYYSVENMKAAYPTAEASVEHTSQPSPVDRRIQDMLSEKGFHVTDPVFTKIGLWMLDRLTEKSKPEDYDAMFQQAVEKFAIALPRVSHPAGNRSHSGAVRNVRLMSSEGEPNTLGGILGAAFA